MRLNDILPRRLIEDAIKAPLAYREFTIDQIEQLVEAEPDIIHSASLRIWDRVVTASPLHPDPMVLADYVNRGDPRMFEAISQIAGQDAIMDIYFIRAEVMDANLSYTTAAQLAVGHTFPNDLHLIDLLLSNPYRPLPRRSRTAARAYHGYGLLGTVVDNSLQVAHELGCTAIVLTAASIALARLFQRCGFVVDDTPTGRRGLLLGHGLPMTRPLSTSSRGSSAGI